MVISDSYKEFQQPRGKIYEKLRTELADTSISSPIFSLIQLSQAVSKTIYSSIKYECFCIGLFLDSFTLTIILMCLIMC